MSLNGEGGGLCVCVCACVRACVRVKTNSGKEEGAEERAPRGLQGPELRADL